MGDTLEAILAANERYRNEFGDKGRLQIFPRRKIAVLTCMDARIDPAKLAGFSEGDAHIIRNAGGRASDDAIRSLVISHKLLGTEEWFVIHHTDCGMMTFTDEIMSRLLEGTLETSQFDGQTWKNGSTGNGSPEGRFVSWLPFSSVTQSVIIDVARIRAHPLVNQRIRIDGFIYDVQSGRLTAVS